MCASFVRDRLEPIDSSFRWLHLTQAAVMPELASNRLKLERIDSPPSLLKAVSACSDPKKLRRVHGPKHSKGLYAYPVFCVVYQLRQGGEKLPSADVRRRPVAGYLVLAMRPVTPEWEARLLDKPGSIKELLPTLCHPVVKAIKGGILLQGMEVRHNLHVTRQAWWCVPGVLDDLTSAG